MASQRDLHLADGRVLRVHDTGASVPSATLALVWHHGSPQSGAILEPLAEAAAARGIRLLSYGRPSYGGSTPSPGRTVASAAADVARLADAQGVGRFAVMGASGGGPHALACAALLPDRVVAAVTFGGIAPMSDDVDWYAGMQSPGGLRAAEHGREAREQFAKTDEFDERQFIAADWEALRGSWRSLGRDAAQAGEANPDGLIDDDVAIVSPWGFDLDRITVPILVVQGGLDRVVPRAHADWLVACIPTAELWLRPLDGHVSVLDALPVAMDWLLHRAEVG